MDWDLILYIVLLLVGLMLIIKCGDWFVDGSSWIAKISGIPNFIIGATIVSLGTTLPEILTSSIAAAQGSVDLAIGNAIGSVNCNIALIMAISLIFMPVSFSRRDYLPKGVLLILAIIALFLCSLPKTLNLVGSFVILGIFIIFIIENIISAKRQSKNEIPIRDDQEIKKEKYRPKDKKEIWKNVFFFLGGAVGIAGGAILLSTYGEKLALHVGVPSGIIGVTIIAIGTSLPELTTTIVAISKKQSDLSVGNIIGANIIDLTLILPLCSFVSKGSLPVSNQSIIFDMPFGILISLIAIVPALIAGKFRRYQGILLLACYVGYITVLILNVNGIIVF